MPKKFKGENTRVTAAKERKAAHQAEVSSKKQVEKERKESQEWGIGAKDTSKKESQRIKKEALLAKKNEAAKILEQEEKELSKYKPILKSSKVSGEEKKAIKRTQKQEDTLEERRVIPEYSASNIEDAIDLLSVATETSFPSNNNLSGGVGTLNNIVEKHPERRFKAALAAYEEREMPRLKSENPGLRYTQLHEILFKNFQKSSENPFNQTNVIQYNSSKEGQKNLIETTIKNVEERLKI